MLTAVGLLVPRQKDQEIHKICKLYGISKYTINTDGTIDVSGDVNLHRKELAVIPLQFGKVSNFYCVRNKLTCLDGAPNVVCGDFHCSFNNIFSLEGGPSRVDGSFDCSTNQIRTLKGAPKIIGGDFIYCSNGQTPHECRYILVSQLGGDFISDNPRVDSIINECKNKKAMLPRAFAALKALGD